MFKAFLALLLCLSLNVSAQTVDANACLELGNIIYTLAMEKAEGKPLKAQLAEMHEALDNTPNAPLIPFFEGKIKEVYQSKKAPEVLGQEFINSCFAVHGDLSKLIGKKV